VSPPFRNEAVRPTLTTMAAAAGLTATGMLIANGLRLSDMRHARQMWRKLADLKTVSPILFDPSMVDELPDPAQRYFRFAIKPGTPLRAVAEIDMHGEIGFGHKADPGYLPMRASEILAPPHGFVWMPTIKKGLISISGSDVYAEGEAWMRFWLLGCLPVARSSSSADFVRSAAARAIAEALWVPAALLPANGVEWRPVDADRACAVFRQLGREFALTLSVAPDGCPTSVVMQRWTNANSEQIFRYQPFGAMVEETGFIDGYKVPIRISAGNLFGTEAYFPFFRAEVDGIRFR
jgi:hypothetical protein